MQQIPVIGFSAYSGTGKTTLIEKLIPCFAAKGLRVGVIKHDAHRFEIDKEGKDSWRFSQAGAKVTLIGSQEQTAVIIRRPQTFEENLQLMRDVDLILVEGYRQERIPRIGISRKATGKGFLPCESGYIAYITDEPNSDTIHKNSPVFGLEETEQICNFILEYFRKNHH